MCTDRAPFEVNTGGGGKADHQNSCLSFLPLECSFAVAATCMSMSSDVFVDVYASLFCLCSVDRIFPALVVCFLSFIHFVSPSSSSFLLFLLHLLRFPFLSPLSSQAKRNGRNARSPWSSYHLKPKDHPHGIVKTLEDTFFFEGKRSLSSKGGD